MGHHFKRYIRNRYTLSCFAGFTSFSDDTCLVLSDYLWNTRNKIIGGDVASGKDKLVVWSVYYYPEPGNIVVKILWKNIFVPGEKNRKGSKTENKPENKSEEIVTKETQETESVQKSIGEESKRTDETSEEKDEKASCIL